MEAPFPLYRKYSNNQSYFVVLNHEQVVELQLIGKKYQLFELHAQNLPQRNFIRDLIDLIHPGIVAIDASDYRAELQRCQRELEEIRLDQSQFG